MVFNNQQLGIIGIWPAKIYPTLNWDTGYNLEKTQQFFLVFVDHDEWTVERSHKSHVFFVSLIHGLSSTVLVIIKFVFSKDATPKSWVSFSDHFTIRAMVGHPFHLETKPHEEILWTCRVETAKLMSNDCLPLIILKHWEIPFDSKST